MTVKENILFPSGKTEICLSLAKRPGNFGSTVHNAGYRELGLAYIYKAIQVSDIEQAIVGIRTLDIKGCSISMPFKESVIKYLDKIDPLAEQVGAVNTIINKNNYLTGFNTDVVGAKEVLSSLNVDSSDQVLVLGAGGVSKAILVALKNIGVENIFVSARKLDVLKSIEERFGVMSVPWSQRQKQSSNVLINATSIGMQSDTDMPVDKSVIAKYNKIMDVVATPPVSRLVKEARNIGIASGDGLTMALFQAAAQFKIYTGHDAPLDVMRKAALSLLD